MGIEHLGIFISFLTSTVITPWHQTEKGIISRGLSIFAKNA